MSSNNNSIITVNNIGKRYRIGTKINPEGLDNFRDAILNAVKAPFRNLKRLRKLTNFEDGGDGETSDIIWALKDVSFEVNKGEVVGIIGRNGSGKSTLLKILSRITEPTEGCIELRGRVSSLLEVGTGFHRELTGRENVYLNGSILGMKKWEIDAKFDEIVAFSEIEKFIDTPVKHYSSGMYVRLAFAVAAHLEPEILLVDEVLAVGDAVFQKKCLGKMGDIAKGGRTVLFVSHNMGAIKSLCHKAVLLNKGQCITKGDSEDIVNQYLKLDSANNNVPLSDCQRKCPPKKVKIVDVHIRNLRTDQKDNHETLDPIEVSIFYEVLSPIKYFAAEWLFKDSDGLKLAYSSSSPLDSILYYPKNKYGCINCRIPKIPFSIGEFSLDVALTIPNVEYLDYVEDAYVLKIITSDPMKSGAQYQKRTAPFFIETIWMQESEEFEKWEMKNLL